MALPSKSKLTADGSSADRVILPRTVTHAKQKGACPGNSIVDLSEDGGDMPPSYDEALHMPAPIELDTNSAEESDTLSDLESGTDLLASHQGCLRIDYVNIDRHHQDSILEPVVVPSQIRHEDDGPQQSPDTVSSRIMNS